MARLSKMLFCALQPLSAIYCESIPHGLVDCSWSAQFCMRHVKFSVVGCDLWLRVVDVAACSRVSRTLPFPHCPAAPEVAYCMELLHCWCRFSLWFLLQEVKAALNVSSCDLCVGASLPTTGSAWSKTQGKTTRRPSTKRSATRAEYDLQEDRAQESHALHEVSVLPGFSGGNVQVTSILLIFNLLRQFAIAYAEVPLRWSTVSVANCHRASGMPTRCGGRVCTNFPSP